MQPNNVGMIEVPHHESLLLHLVNLFPRFALQTNDLARGQFVLLPPHVAEVELPPLSDVDFSELPLADLVLSDHILTHHSDV